MCRKVFNVVVDLEENDMPYPIVFRMYRTTYIAESRCCFVGEWLYVARNETEGDKSGRVHVAIQLMSPTTR